MAIVTRWEHLAEATLNTETFPSFYAQIARLRFPIPVDEVLELRDLINHSADKYEEPNHTPGYTEFRDSLENAIYSFGIDDKRYRERLLKILVMLRELHYQHSIESRNREARLRLAKTDNRQARARSARYGWIAMGATLLSGLAWFLMIDATWQVKALTAVFAFLSWDYFRSLPTLDRDHERLTKDLNEVLRQRVENINWKTLIHKLALILGYKRIQGVEVFHRNHGPDADNYAPLYH